jgi:hypothetical protein
MEWFLWTYYILFCFGCSFETFVLLGFLRCWALKQLFGHVEQNLFECSLEKMICIFNAPIINPIEKSERSLKIFTWNEAKANQDVSNNGSSHKLGDA